MASVSSSENTPFFSTDVVARAKGVVNRKGVSAGYKKSRVVWERATSTKHNFAAVSREKAGYLTKKNWVLVKLGDKDVYANINSIRKRFNLGSEADIKKMGAEALGNSIIKEVRQSLGEGSQGVDEMNQSLEDSHQAKRVAEEFSKIEKFVNFIFNPSNKETVKLFITNYKAVYKQQIDTRPPKVKGEEKLAREVQDISYKIASHLGQTLTLAEKERAMKGEDHFDDEAVTQQLDEIESELSGIGEKNGVISLTPSDSLTPRAQVDSLKNKLHALRNYIKPENREFDNKSISELESQLTAIESKAIIFRQIQDNLNKKRSAQEDGLQLDKDFENQKTELGILMTKKEALTTSLEELRQGDPAYVAHMQKSEQLKSVYSDAPLTPFLDSVITTLVDFDEAADKVVPGKDLFALLKAIIVDGKLNAGLYSEMAQALEAAPQRRKGAYHNPNSKYSANMQFARNGVVLLEEFFEKAGINPIKTPIDTLGESLRPLN